MLLVATLFIFTLFAGCSPANTEQAAEPAAEEETVSEPAEAEEEEAAVEAQPAAEEETEAETAEEAPAEPKILNTVMTKEPISLDANKANDSMSSNVLYNLSEGLLRYYDGQIIPAAAETWEVSEDGLTYTFHLRESVWEDGEPVTAQQFEYSMKRFLDPNTAAAFVDSLYPVLNAEEYNNGEADVADVGIIAEDDSTLVITLDYPVPYFLTNIATGFNYYPLRQDLVEQFGDTYAADGESFLANGPFTLVSWEHEASLHLVKNPTYWNAAEINLDEMNILIISDNNTIASMYENGELDYVPQLSSEFAANFPEVRTALSGGFQFLEFNVTGMTPETGAVLSNTNFRKALSFAIDREALGTAVYGAAVLPADRYFSEIMPGVKGPYVNEYPLTEGATPKNAQPEQAQAYLAAALEELGLTVDELPTLTYVCMESEKHKLFAEAFVDAWSQVLGLSNVEISILPVPQALQAGMTQQFDIFLLGLGADTDPYPLLNYWTIDNSINWGFWEDQAYTDMVTATNTILDPAERFQALFEAEKYLIANGPNEPLFFNANYYVYNEDVYGIVQSALGAESELIYVDIIR